MARSLHFDSTVGERSGIQPRSCEVPPGRIGEAGQKSRGSCEKLTRSRQPSKLVTMRRNSVTGSLVLTLALASSVWASCAAELMISPMACCLAAQPDCGAADPSDACCKAEQQARHDSIAARSERPDAGHVSSPGVLAAPPGMGAIAQPLTAPASFDVFETASSPPKYLLDSVLRV